MKKLVSLLLCILFALPFPISGSAVGMNKTLASDGYAGRIFSACEINDMLYVLSNLGIYSWDYKAETPEQIVDLSMYQKNSLSSEVPKNAAEKELWEHGMNHLFALGDTLYGLHPYTGQVFKIDGQEAVPIAVIPKEQFFYTDQEIVQPKEIVSILTAGDVLYLVLASFTAEAGDVRELYAWDLTAPQMDLLNAPGLNAAFPGTEDTLAVRLAQNEEGTSALWLYDIPSQTYTRQIWEETQEAMTGYVWNSRDHSLYFTGGNGKVNKVLPEGKTQVKAYLPLSFPSSSDQAFISSRGNYVYMGMSSLFVRDISQEGERAQTTVRVMGLLDPSISIAYSAARPDVALAIESTGSDFLSIQQSMVSGDSDIDLYIVNTGRSYQDIREKGYAVPMDANQHLVELSNQFYTAVKGVLYQDGHLVAFPVSILPDTWTLNRTVWNELDLGEYPTTFAELFAAVNRWDDEFAQDYPGYILLEANEGFLGFVAFIVKQYLLQYESSDAPVSFDSPDFRQAITSALEYRNLLDTPTVGRDPLIMTYHQYYGVGFNDSDEVISIPPPALTPDSPRMVKASMELFILNPLSKNQQAALDFLSFYADNMDVNNKYSLNATLDTPVRQERFDEDQQGIHDQIANLEQMMKTAEDAEKVDYQAIIDREKTRYEKRESDLWLITQESIGIYQKIAANLVVPSRSIFSNDRGSPNDQVIEQVIARFADGQISVDQFIQELNKKAQMMFMEGK